MALQLQFLWKQILCLLQWASEMNKIMEFSMISGHVEAAILDLDAEKPGN